MFYSEDPESFFGGDSEYGNEGVTELTGNEFGSGETISEFGRDYPGIDNGGVIEGGTVQAGSGESLGSGGGKLDGSNAGQTEKEEETSFLVEQADEKEELVNFVVSVIQQIEGENIDGASAEIAEESSETPDADTPTANESVYTIDDIYTALDEIKTCCISIRDENISYHVGQDITGRMSVAGLFMILGGIVVYAFVGRIR